MEIVKLSTVKVYLFSLNCRINETEVTVTAEILSDRGEEKKGKKGKVLRVKVQSKMTSLLSCCQF